MEQTQDIVAEAKKDYPKIGFNTKKLGLFYKFDTMQDAEGWDRLCKNIIRVWGIVGILLPVVMDIHYALEALIFFAGFLLVGVSRFEYFQHDKKKFWFEVWG